MKPNTVLSNSICRSPAVADVRSLYCFIAMTLVSMCLSDINIPGTDAADIRVTVLLLNLTT